MKSLLLGTQALSLLEKEDFPVLRSLPAIDAKRAVEAALKIGFPVTLKVLSPDVIHKTEIHGIRLALRDEAEVVQAFEDLVNAFTLNYPEKRLDGVMVQENGKGLEVIIGVLNDVQFGPVLMFGLGGVFVEAMRDVSFRLIPVESFDTMDMIEELINFQVLKNPRSGAIDLVAVEDLLCRISNYVAGHPEVQEMDLNPVFVSSRGVSICDVRILLKEPSRTSQMH